MLCLSNICSHLRLVCQGYNPNILIFKYDGNGSSKKFWGHFWGHHQNLLRINWGTVMLSTISLVAAAPPIVKKPTILGWFFFAWIPRDSHLTCGAARQKKIPFRGLLSLWRPHHQCPTGWAQTKNLSRRRLTHAKNRTQGERLRAITRRFELLITKHD